MSAVRFLLATAVVLLAVLCAPYSLSPGINGADLVVWAAPVALVGIVARPRAPKTLVESASTPTAHPQSAALSTGPDPIGERHEDSARP